MKQMQCAGNLAYYASIMPFHVKLYWYNWYKPTVAS